MTNRLLIYELKVPQTFFYCLFPIANRLNASSVNNILTVFNKQRMQAKIQLVNVKFYFIFILIILKIIYYKYLCYFLNLFKFQVLLQSSLLFQSHFSHTISIYIYSLCEYNKRVKIINNI